MTVRRMIESSARLSETTHELQELARKTERQNIDDLKHLNAELVSYVYYQVATHFFTAALCVGLGAAATLKGVGDAASAVTIGNKGGEALSTFIRAGETRAQGAQRIVDHKLSKGPEKRHDEFLQQYIRWVQEFQQATFRARNG